MSGDAPERPDWQYAIVLLIVVVLLGGLVYEVHALLWWFAGLLTQLAGRFEVHVQADAPAVAVVALCVPATVYVWRTTGRR